MLHEVDYQYFDDIMNCTFSVPFNNDEVLRNWHNVTQLIGFPNAFEAGNVSPWLNLFRPSTFFYPGIKAVEWLIKTITGTHDLNTDPSTSQFTFDSKRGREEVIYRQTKMQKSKSLYANYWSDFLDRKSKEKE